MSSSCSKMNLVLNSQLLSNRVKLLIEHDWYYLDFCLKQDSGFLVDRSDVWSRWDVIVSIKQVQRRPHAGSANIIFHMGRYNAEPSSEIQNTNWSGVWPVWGSETACLVASGKRVQFFLFWDVRWGSCWLIVFPLDLWWL
jgi:hypothetical protein